MATGLVGQVKVGPCTMDTPKSTTENLGSDFEMFDARLEGAEHFVKSQVAKDWIVVPTRIDDGCFTDGDVERPALMPTLAEKTVSTLALALEIWGQWRIKRAELEEWIDAQPGGGDGGRRGA